MFSSGRANSRQGSKGWKIDAALIACQSAPETTSDVVTYLIDGQPKIFHRVALHVLSKCTDAAPELAFNLLADPRFIGENWCEEEYAELARARISSLSSDEQRTIFQAIDALPDQYRARWKVSFAAHHHRPPTPKDERLYVLSIVRNAMWKWQDVLPPERKRLIDASAAELGHPDAWREELFPREISPLSGADYSTRSVPEIIAFLESWRPQTEPIRQTITALAEQLRLAVEREPTRFTEAANQFAAVRPIYVRRFLEGLDNPKVLTITAQSSHGDRSRNSLKPLPGVSVSPTTASAPGLPVPLKTAVVASGP
jgi:hypothetical protein